MECPHSSFLYFTKFLHRVGCISVVTDVFLCVQTKTSDQLRSLQKSVSLDQVLISHVEKVFTSEAA